MTPAQKQRKAEYARARYAANRDQMLQQTKDWQAANRDKVRAYQRAWYIANREHMSSYSKAWAQANAARKREVARAWREANPERASAIARAAGSKRRASCTTSTTQAPTAAELRRILEDPCLYCDAPAEQIDHFMPLSRGGTHTHTLDNLVAACAACNYSKRNKIPDVEWFGRPGVAAPNISR